MRYRLGELLPLRLVTRNAAGSRVAPDAAPWVNILPGGGGQPAASVRLPLDASGVATGVFFARQLLVSPLAAGDYILDYFWTIAGTVYHRLENLTIVGGGHDEAQTTELFYYRWPQAEYLIRSLSDRRIVWGRGPRL